MNIHAKFHKNQKIVKFSGKMFWGEFHRGGGNLGGEFRGGIFEKKKWIPTKWGCKIGVYTKFHPNRTLGK